MKNSVPRNSAPAAVATSRSAKRTYASPSLVPMTSGAAKAILKTKADAEDTGTKEMLEHIERLLNRDDHP